MTDNITRRAFIALMASTATLAACSGKQEGQDQPETAEEAPKVEEKATKTATLGNLALEVPESWSVNTSDGRLSASTKGALVMATGPTEIDGLNIEDIANAVYLGTIDGMSTKDGDSYGPLNQGDFNGSDCFYFTADMHTLGSGEFAIIYDDTEYYTLQYASGRGAAVEALETYQSAKLTK